jgi:hypothetical protein
VCGRFWWWLCCVGVTGRPMSLGWRRVPLPG